MSRFSPLLFVVVITTPLLAQSTFDKKTTIDLIAVARFCANVKDYSDSQIPRIFAQAISAYGQSTGWVEFDSRSAWRRAGRPKPMALVWHRDARIVRVAIYPSDDESPRAYADYCYREDGTLARLRSVPSERQQCEPDRYCAVVLREVRFYPPVGPAIKSYGDVEGGLLNLVDGNTEGILEARPAERMLQIFVPMKWPEYLHVTELPFNKLLYATLR